MNDKTTNKNKKNSYPDFQPKLFPGKTRSQSLKKRHEFLDRAIFLIGDFHLTVEKKEKVQKLYLYFDYLVENKDLIWAFPEFKDKGFIEAIWTKLKLFYQEPKFSNEKAIHYLKELFPNRNLEFSN